MPEELALEDALGQSAGVHGDQRARGAQRDRVQRLRHQPLAGAVFAGDQHVGVRGSHARNDVEHGAHGRRLRDELGEPFGAQRVIFGFEALAFAQGAAKLDLRLEDGGEARVVPGLLDELHGPPGRHHDDGQRGVERLNAVKQLQAFLAGGGIAGVIEVHEYRVEVARFDRIDGGGRRVDGFGLVAFALDEESQRFENVRLIVGNEDTRRTGIG